MSETDKRWGWLLIGLLAGMILGVLTFPDEAWGAEPIITYKDGQTVKDDEVYPSLDEVKEAQEFLSANRITVPADIEALCEEYGEKTNIAPELLESLIFVESSYQQHIVDNSGTCKGLCQIKPTAHSLRMQSLGVSDIFDKRSNIAVGADFLRELFEEYRDVTVVLAMYNGDSRATEPGYISEYAEKVMRISQAFERAKYK